MELTKRQLDMIDAAIDIIANRGYKELTTKNIAQQMGISEAALYRHYPSKHELILAVLNYFEDISQRAICQIDHEIVNPLMKVREFVLNRYRLFVENPDLAKVLFSEELFKNDPRYTEYMQRIMHRHKDEVVSNLKQAMVGGDIDHEYDLISLFRIVIGSMRFLVAQWNLTEHGFDLVLEGERLWNTIEKMIKEPK